MVTARSLRSICLITCETEQMVRLNRYTTWMYLSTGSLSPGNMTSSERDWKAVVNQLTGWLEPGGWTDSPLVTRVRFWPAKNPENSSPKTSRSVPVCGTIRPLR